MIRRSDIFGGEKNAKPRTREPSSASLSRRVAMTAVLALPFAAQAAADETDLLTGAAAGMPLRRAPAELVRRSQEAVKAFIRGDVPAYLTFVNVADDFTLMQPFGEVNRGFNRSPEWARGIADYFKDGEADVELIQSYASGDKPGDIAVLVTVEHQHAKVGGLPDQQWPLRVTLVFRHGETDWELVHRHADLTVKRISLEQAAAMARGDWPGATD